MGRQATITAMLVIGCISKPVDTPTASAPAAISGSDQYHSLSMPVLILSTVVSVTSRTLGSRLKAISGTHMPARIESTSRLRISPRKGAGWRSASHSASCGQTTVVNRRNTQWPAPAWFSSNTMPVGNAASPMPSVRRRWIRRGRRWVWRSGSVPGDGAVNGIGAGVPLLVAAIPGAPGSSRSVGESVMAGTLRSDATSAAAGADS